MKNQLIYFQLSCCFLLGTIGNVNADSAKLDGGIVLVVHNCKTGEPIHSFSIPDSYFNKDGSLVAPLEISLSQNGKSPAFTIQSKDVNIELPASLTGTYEVQIKIGNFSSTGIITL